MMRSSQKIFILGFIFFSLWVDVYSKVLTNKKISILDGVLENIPQSLGYVRRGAEVAKDVYVSAEGINVVKNHDVSILKSIVIESISANELFKNLQAAVYQINNDGMVEQKEELDDIVSDEDILVFVLRKELLERCKDFFKILCSEKYEKYLQPLLEESIGKENLENSIFYQSILLVNQSVRRSSSEVESLGDGLLIDVFLEKNINTIEDLSAVCHDILSFINDLFESLPRTIKAYKNYVKEKVKARREEAFSKQETAKKNKN
jgi:hypothetical protein